MKDNPLTNPRCSSRLCVLEPACSGEVPQVPSEVGA